jgi:hypothetical protein
MIRRALPALLATLLLAGAAHLGYLRQQHHTTPRAVLEDQRGWNCSTQGNRICGPTTQGEATR